MRAALFGLAVLLVGLFAGMFYLRSGVAREREAFDAYVAELGIEERDWTTPAPPEGENAFPVLAGIMEELERAELRDQPDEWDLGDDGNPLEEDWPAIEAWVDSVAPYLERLHAASELPRSVAPKQSEEDLGFDSRAWSIFHSTFELLRWRCRVAERRQAPAATALRPLATLLRLADQAAEGPMVLELLRDSTAANACELIPRTARLAEFDAARARGALDPLITRLLDNRRFLRALELELAYPVAAIREFEEGESDMEFLPGPFDMRGTARLYREARTYLRANVEAQARIREVGLLRYSEEAAGQLEAQGEFLTPAMFPKVAGTRLRHVAQLRLARVLLALHVHRQAHGAFPATLAELAPLFPNGVPLDPSTEEDFPYEPDVRIGSAMPRTEHEAGLGYPLR